MGETSTNVATLNMKQAIKINVKEGCEVDNPCDSNPCPQHSYCSDDWDSYSCVCDPGNALTHPMCSDRSWIASPQSHQKKNSSSSRTLCKPFENILLLL